MILFMVVYVYGLCVGTAIARVLPLFIWWMQHKWQVVADPLTQSVGLSHRSA